ncbi:Tubulin polyglutamylase TTLL5 [Fasciola hepatica]|uniref:Tubulin polyglutamylase TTLL5 n=1 Tax=Fasciola hepatica TaxID=6192 RepID=A0A4E0QWP1_FASHE|nr:Tubulin polyglutamylase TTLL5 [Fasciola hepatica]
MSKLDLFPLQVNLSPSLACDSPLDFKVKSHMITDLFNLVGIVCHDPTRKTHGGMNSLHMKADGHAAVPPKQPTYFVSADEQVNSHSSLMSNVRPSDHFGHQTVRSNGCCCTSDGFAIGLAGVASSHLLPKGVSIEETRLMRRLQEEAARAGGWIRLIPNPEVWEQYASIWPNDNIPWYLSSDRRYYCTSIDGSRTSLAETGHSEMRRFPANSLLTSAFMASLAAYTLHGLVATVYSHEASDNSDDDSSSDSDSWSQSSSHFDATGNGNRKTRVPCAAQLRFLHPNSATIDVDLIAYLQQTTDQNESNNYQTTCILNPPVPSRSTITRSRLPLHNMPERQMQKCLNSLFTDESDSADIPREQCQRVIACYAHTLSHMPFYMRKLGEQPVDLPGVCLRPGCKHDRVRNSIPCGIYQGKRVFESNVPSRTSSVHFGLNSGDIMTAEVEHRNSNELRRSYNKCTRVDSGRRSRPNSGTLEPKQGCPSLDATRLSATQARHAFAAYLTRLQTRLLFESRQSVLPANSNRATLQREHKKLDLMVRFLRKASEHLSLQAIATICCKDSANQCAGDIRRFFRISIPDQSRSLAERKRALSRLLSRFIQIYQYETVAVLSEHHLKPHKASRCVEAARFWRFIRTATESQLEDLLSRYTRLHHSVDVFMGRSSDRLSIKEDDLVSDDRPNSRRSRSRSVEGTVPIVSGINSSSSDSGFVSVGDLGSGPESPASSAQRDTVHSARSDLTIIKEKHPASNGSRSSRASDISDTKLSTWSSCCPTLRRHSSESSHHSRCSDKDQTTDCQTHPLATDHATDHKKCDRKTSKRSVKKVESEKPCSSPNAIGSVKQRLSQTKHKFGMVSGTKKEITDSFSSAPSSQPSVYTTNSSSQTTRPSVSLRMCRPRHSARRPTSRASSPILNNPLVYSTRKRPQTAIDRVYIRSHIRPQSTYRNPGMIPLFSFKGLRSTVSTNNHNVYGSEEKHTPCLSDKPPAVQRLVTESDYLDGSQLTSDPPILIGNEWRPGTCPPVYMPFNAQLYQMPDRSHQLSVYQKSHAEGGSHTADEKPNMSRSSTNPTNFATANLIRSPSSRRVHPTS